MDYSSQNYVRLAGTIEGNPKMVPLHNITGAPFLIAELFIVVIDEKQHISGRMIREPQVIPVYFYGATADRVLKEVRNGDELIIDAKLKIDTNSKGVPRIRVVGRKFYDYANAPYEDTETEAERETPYDHYREYEERYERYDNQN